MLFIFVVPLVGLYAQKYQPKENRRQQQLHLKRAPTQLRRADRHCHRQTAANQHGGVQRAHDKIKAPAGCGKLGEIPPAVNQVRAKHSAEEHDFGAQEPPHAQRSRVALLLYIRKMMAQFRAFLVLNRKRGFPDTGSIAQVSPLPAAASYRTHRLPKLLRAFHRN